VLARRRAAGGVDLVQGREEVAEVGRELGEIGDAADGRGVALDPPVLLIDPQGVPELDRPDAKVGPLRN